jgi:hypothetical protein
MTRRFCLALVAAASLVAHLKGLGSPLTDYHYHRQCNTATIARNYHRNGLHFGTPQIDWEGDYEGKAATEFPLYMWLMGLFWPAGGLGELWGRLLSAGFSALTSVYLFLFLERRFSREAALCAGIVFSALPVEVYFGRTVQPEALALLATMAALYHWDAWLDSPKNKLQWAAATAFAFLAVAHKLPYLYILLPLAALAWLPPRRRPYWDPWCWGSCGLALIAVFGWYKYASSGVYVVPAHAGEFLKMLEYDRLPYFTFFLFFSRLPELAATYGGLVLGAFGVAALYKKPSFPFFALWWLAVAVDQIIGGGYAHWHEYTCLPWAPVNAAFVGAGIERLALNRPSKRRAAAAGLLALAIPVHAALRVGHWYRNGFPYLTGARAAAEAVSRPEDLFVCNERSSSAFLFYLDRKGWAWEATETSAANGRVLLDKKIAEGAKFYATAASRLALPEVKEWSDYLRSRYPVAYAADDMLVFRLRP